METEKLNSQMLEMNSKLAEMVAEFQSKMQQTFTDLLQAFFDETPRVKTIVWSQYTPYFNDGDECTFSVNEPFFLEELLEEDSEDLGDAYYYEDVAIELKATPELVARYRGYAENRELDREYWTELANKAQAALDADDGTMANCGAISTTIQSNPEIMQAVFDNHVTVYVTREGSWTAEYDHE